MKTLCFLIIKKMASSNERVKELVAEIHLLSLLSEKLNLTLLVMQHNRHLETTKKSGAQKVKN